MEPFSFSVELIKQNSTFLEDFNSSLKISGGTQAPPPLHLPLLRACVTFLTSFTISNFVFEFWSTLAWLHFSFRVISIVRGSQGLLLLVKKGLNKPTLNKSPSARFKTVSND